jgi:hypothetical protein
MVMHLVRVILALSPRKSLGVIVAFVVKLNVLLVNAAGRRCADGFVESRYGAVLGFHACCHAVQFAVSGGALMDDKVCMHCGSPAIQRASVQIVHDEWLVPPDYLRHWYTCLNCGQETPFDDDFWQRHDEEWNQ